MNPTASYLALTLLAVGASPAAAEPTVTMGDDIVVAAGQEVDSIVSMGGDVTIAGVAEGDVVTMGGSVTVLGVVEGDVATAGGDVRVEGVVEGDVATAGGTVTFGPSGVVQGEVDATHGGWRSCSVASSGGGLFGGFFSKLGGFALLFLLALGFRHLASDRFHTIRAAMVRAPVKAPLLGLAFFCAAIVAILGSAVTVVGIPIAAVMAIGLLLATYVGLAMSAAVVGAVLPFERLKDRETAQLAAGVGVLFVASLVPFFGTLALVLATLFGLGAVGLTRLGQRPQSPLTEGPYR